MKIPTGVLKYQEWYLLLPWALLAFLLSTWGFDRCGNADPPFNPPYVQTAVVIKAIPVAGKSPRAARADVPKVIRFSDKLPSCLVGTSPLQDAAANAIFLIKPSFQYLSPGYPWQLTLGALLFIVVVFFSVVRLAVRNIRHDARVAWARRKRDHVIVCGLGRTGSQIARNFHQAGFDLIAITLDATSGEAQSLERQGVLVLNGDAAQPSLLILAGLTRSNALIVASGSDATNVEIGMRAFETLRASKRRVKILAQIRDKWLFDAIVDHSTAILGDERLEFRLFNVGEAAASTLLQSPDFARAYPVTAKNPKLLLVGLGECGSDVLIGAALGNFALPHVRPSATILDNLGADSKFVLERKCSQIDQVLDVQFKACDLASDNPQEQSAIADIVSVSTPDAVVITLGDDDISLRVALDARRALDMAGKPQTPIFVRLRQKQKLGKFLADMENVSNIAGRLVPFGDLSALTTPGALFADRTNRIARAVHTVFREIAGANLTTNVSWEVLNERDKQQNRSFAEHIPTKLRLIGRDLASATKPLTKDEVEILARAEHWRWCVVHRARGWSYAAIRDNYKQHHPLLVNWNALPEDIRNMNRTMVAGIPEILSNADKTA